MATNKKLRTPIIKPRTQGGTLYTFGSALEDIGLNINESNNKVELSHYVLLDIPTFGKTGGNLRLPTIGTYTTQIGDNMFAEYFQDAILNMETVLRNTNDYNFAALKTVSERVFWKYIFKDKSINDFIYDDKYGYFYEKPNSTIAKAFGRIMSGSQRIDSYGIYNETFVQIPSSYGQMRVLFKRVNDENYAFGNIYTSTNNGTIEGIEPSELNGNSLIATGISGKGIFDLSNYRYTADSSTDLFEAEMSIEKLRNYYGNQQLTIDDIGFGDVTSSVDFTDRFSFNAILLYYSIFDATGTDILATNAFGVYILDNAIESTSAGIYYFPELVKIKTNGSATGTSFSFRVNIKPTSAYTGDVTVSDNSSAAFAESEDFTDIVKNLSRATDILKSNARALQALVNTNQQIKNLASNALEKVGELEETINNITTTNTFDTIVTKNIDVASTEGLNNSLKTIAPTILNNIKTTYDNIGNFGIELNTNGLSGDALSFANKMVTVIDGVNYVDMSKIVALILAAMPQLQTLKAATKITSR